LRAFLSYDIADPDFVARVERIQDDLKSTGADLKLVNPHIMHFTIRFFGEIDEQEKNEIIGALHGNVENFELELKFRGVGAFPDERRISVIWIGIDQASAVTLEKKASEVNALLKSVPSLRGEREEKFSPHVTISRVRSGRNKDKLADFLRHRRDEDFGSAKIRHLRLKLSELTPSGPVYTDLHVFE
jgi:RNA 2',3'-cyclic 3'-phosphodiesterase